MSAVLLAAPPSETGLPDSHTLPSPNQSVSIEEEVPGPTGLTDEAKSGGTVIEGAAQDAANTGSGTFVGRPPVFLGRKRSSADPQAQVTLSEHTPWYRTSFGALGIVLALMGVLYLALKRWAPSIKAQDGGLVRVMGRTVVGPRQSLVLLHVGRRVVLVGVSPDRIDRVCEISESQEVDALTAQASAGRSRGDFSAWLDREAAEFVDADKRSVNEPEGSESRQGLKSLSDLLRKLRTTRV